MASRADGRAPRQSGLIITFFHLIAPPGASFGPLANCSANGPCVNLASRICAAAEDGQTLIDQAAAAEIGGALALTPLGTRPFRGFAEAVPVFSVAERPPVAAAQPLAG